METQESLRAKYNPEGSELRRLQMRMLDILIVVDEICRRHDIPYWIEGGTLLGAVRHGGFIPWDDDCIDEKGLCEAFEMFERGIALAI